MDLEMNETNDVRTNEHQESTNEHHPKLRNRVGSTLKNLLIQNRGMIFSQMGAIGYTGLNITAYEAGLYVPASEIPMLTSFGVFIMTSLGMLLTRPPLPSCSTEVLLVTLSGLFAGAGSFCLYLAIIFVNPGDAVTLYFTAPVICTFYGITCLGERFSIDKILLVILAVVGVSFVSGPTFIFETPFSHGPMYSVGLVLALLASINYGTGFTLFNYTSVKYNTHPIMLTLGLASFSTSFAAVTSFTFDNPVRIPGEAYVWIVLFICSCFSLWGISCLGFALKYESSSFVSIATTTEILYTYLAQFIIFGIKPTWLSGVGAVMILVSCIGLNFIRTEKEETGSDNDDLIEPLIKEDKR